MRENSCAGMAGVEVEFHKLIRARITQFTNEVDVELPRLKAELDLDEDSDRAWFPVPGMYGGFAYAWDPQHVGERLIVDSWCRVVGESGQQHEVTASGYTLLEDGY